MTSNKKARPAFVVIWEFRIRPAKRGAFEKVYGPEGDWAKFFRRDNAYIRTELIRDRASPGCYLTLDYWTSRAAYLSFKKENNVEYAAIDKKCESMTIREKFVGEFESTRELSRARRLRSSPLTRSPNPRYSTHVRLASTEDIPAILELERQTDSAAHWPETTYRRLFEQETPACVPLVIEGEDAKNLNGLLIARISGDECELENVVVRRQRQSQGLGSKLLHALAEAARKQNVTHIFLEVRESNAAARALYEKSGFEISGRRKSYYSNPAEDAVLYTLQL
jgi:[ribosomal protein S18]-alanine N-acetyltransferase